MRTVRLGLRLALGLALRDLRRRWAESLLLVLALTVAATTLTLGLVLHGQTAVPYAATRAATRGPDVVATLFPAPGSHLTDADRAGLVALVHRPEVVAHSPAFPMTWAGIEARGVSGVAEVQGRDAGASPVDRPEVVSGHWVEPGGVVVERSFAQSMGVRLGDRVALGAGHPRVVGIAVSAALPPYPQLCTIGCILDDRAWFSAQPGLVWTTRADAAALATAREPLVWFEYLRLRDPSAAPAFASRLGDSGPPAGRPQLLPWQDVAHRQAEQLANERAVVVFGSSLLAILALATLAVLVGGRLADEGRRVGLLKASGATPRFVALVLVTAYLALGLVGAALGLTAGRLLAPSLVTRSAGLLGHLGSTSVTTADVLTVVGAVLALVVLASVVPAWRAARRSTVEALAESGRAPRRRALVVRVSARLPVPALLGLRLATRRPRRAVLTSLSVAVAVCGSVVVLCAQASLGAESGSSGGPADPQAAQLHAVMVALTVLLTVMAAVNLVFVTRATSVDARRLLAVVRSLGASPAETAWGVGVAQLVPAVAGLVLGVLSGVALFQALSVAHPVMPSVVQLLGLSLLTVGLVLVLTAIPA
ncbi:MAG: FtsX-like permease family protein, partial [Marmoricola sp.]|nr:FtsX-like permease family protein [Marmoricola sp.]